MTAIQQIKQGARKTWAEGDYRLLARYLPPASAHLVRAANVGPGDEVLDIACGTGVTAITAARAGATVSGIDLTPDLLAVAEDEAALAKVEGIKWHEGDAEDLFTIAYMHLPGELEDEVTAAGFAGVEVYGVEGPGGLVPDIAERWSDEVRRETILTAARMVEQDPHLLPLSSHLVAVGWKPS